MCGHFGSSSLVYRRTDLTEVDQARATVHLLKHSQCGTILTVWPGKPGGTIRRWRSQRGSHLVLDPQVTGVRGRQAMIGVIACSTPFLSLSQYPSQDLISSFDPLSTIFFSPSNALLRQCVTISLTSGTLASLAVSKG
jgi:hypothetical protein